MEMLDTTVLPFWPRRVWHLACVFCLVAIAFKLAKLLVKRREFVRVLQPFPGPPKHWLYGHVHEFPQDGTDLEKNIKWGEKYPLAFPLWFGPFVAFLNIHHPEYVKTILASTEPKDDFAYKFLIPWIGNGLLVSQGQKWFRHRRLLTPGFHYDILKHYVTLMADSARAMLDKWEIYADQDEPFELFNHVSLMTLDSIMQCAFSCRSNCQTESGTNSYIQAVYELSYLVNLRFRTFPYHSDIIFYLSPHGYRFRKACKIAHKHTEEVVRQRKEALKNERELGAEQKKRNLDFLDILLCTRDEDQQGLSDEDIRAEVDTFMFEGHDTTASGISWIFYALAGQPEHQEKCRAEVMDVLKGKDTMEWEDLSKIPYTTMCIKECLRLYPPVPGTSRKLTKPMTFFDGRTLPEGFLVGTSVFGIHRNHMVWENPHEFNPLRFLPENCAKRPPHAFVPFSAGPRNCIGQNFAMNEMKVAVALTLKRYRLERDPSFVPKMIPRLVLRSLNGIHLKIKRVTPDP
ncbi:cytochrome P450 4B1 isoform X2 [Brienomyrus brachyistius]|nr:cytochrome P450 4B1 isoform X2 [Brienomyrus brachyistius]XP_048881826.1 cytochrome P450 4B1 isoform X2 [Brienomyrus brachyistius]XP_048881827.1 cytochrome P450 4B1 isoform X2 [Brienomyrus brachyistius]